MLLTLLILHLVIAFILYLIKSEHSGKIAFVLSLLPLGLSIYVLTTFLNSGPISFNEAWLPSIGASLSFKASGLNIFLILLTNILVPLIILSSVSQYSSKPNSFYALISLMQFGLLGVFTAYDGLLFYMFWEITLIPIYFISAIWGGTDKIKVTIKFFIYTFLGSIFMLLALISMKQHAPNGTFEYSDLMNAQLSGKELYFIYGSLFLAFAIKIPIFPFHTWQPDTYVTAPSQGTMLLSGIMLKMGLYGIMFWMLPLAPEAWDQAGHYMLLLSVVGIVYASIIAISQNDIKRLFAYSSISHVGMIAAGIFTLESSAWYGAGLQMFAHGINVVGLFFIAEIIQRRSNTLDLRKLGGIAKSAPVFAMLSLIVVLGSLAVPLANGFTGEFLILNGIFQYDPYLSIAAGLSIIFTAVYLLRFYQKAMLGKANETTIEFKDVTTTEAIVLSIISLIILITGFFPSLLMICLKSDIIQLLNNSLSF